MSIASTLFRLSVALMLCLPATAQVTTASFYGTVQDPSGALVSGAQVSLTQSETGSSRSQTTSSTGEFAFQFLPVGTYTLQISAAGFRPLESRGIELGAAQQARQAYVLEVGSVTDKVEVRGEAPLVNSVTAEQRQSISTSEVRELPVARRTLSNIFALGTGIAATGAGQFSLNGLGQSAASISMDGIDASSSPLSPQAQLREGFNYISVVSMEAVQEVQVSKGVFSAEYGRALSGNINVVTKSGTNNWHGSAFELFNAEELNGRQQFLTTRPGVTFNQYGGSLGGRIVRDRAFMFGALEGYQERSASTVQGEVPTPQLRADMIAAVPAFKTLLDTYPLPNQPFAPNANIAPFVGSGSVTGRDLSLSLRPDVWVKANRLLLTGTYARSRPVRTVPRIQPVNTQVLDGVSERFNITATYIGGPNWSSESRFGYNRNDRNRVDGFWDLKDPSKPEAAFGGRRLPTLDFLGVSSSSEYNIIGRAPHRSFDQKFALNTARHSLKFGGLFFVRELGTVNIENPLLRYQNRADLLANIPSLAQFTFGRADFDARATEWGLFLQDDFRVSTKLTLNLGLRYDVFGRFSIHGQGEPGKPPFAFNYSSLSLPGFVPGPFRSPEQGPVEPDRFNLGPRIGFAYNPDGRSRTVVRGGFSVMYTMLSGEIIRNSVQNAADEPFRARLSRADALALNIKFPAFNEDILRLVKSGLATPSFQYLDPNTRSPYSMNYSLTVERALTSTLALETAFVGTRGVKFQLNRFYNEINRQTGRRPNPLLSTDRYYDGSESTTYSSWQTSLRKRFSSGLLANVHYTWGKAMAYNRGDLGAGGGGSNVQDFFDVRANRGPSENDITHRLTGNILYEVPRMPSLGRVGSAILGAWSISSLFTAQTGVPLVLTQPTALQVQRPDALGTDPYLSDWRTTLQYLNRAAFAQVPLVAATGAAVRPGSAGNGAVRGPGLWNIDLGLGRVLRLTEALRLQIRGEFLNALNHTNFTGVNTNITAARFGQVIATAGARTIQFQTRLSF